MSLNINKIRTEVDSFEKFQKIKRKITLNKLESERTKMKWKQQKLSGWAIKLKWVHHKINDDLSGVTIYIFFFVS